MVLTVILPGATATVNTVLRCELYKESEVKPKKKKRENKLRDYIFIAFRKCKQSV